VTRDIVVVEYEFTDDNSGHARILQQLQDCLQVLRTHPDLVKGSKEARQCGGRYRILIHKSNKLTTVRSILGRSLQ
jgi:hypothetical protein